MARNRKRRNDRRPRRSADEASVRPGVATARGQRADGARADGQRTDGPRTDSPRTDSPRTDGQRPDGERAEEFDETPEALQHATPDVELAEAQLAIGRAQSGATEPEDELDKASFEDEAQEAAGTVDEEQVGTQLSSRGESLPAPRGGARLIHFLQGSWRELQRVQWPDRRQVMQATGVVIGFVIVAGLFLGAADWVAQRLVNLILK